MANRGGGTPLVNFRRLSVPTPWWVVLLFAGPFLIWRAVCLTITAASLMVRGRRALPEVAALLTLVWAWHEYGWLPLVLAAALAAGLAGLWWWRWRESCQRWFVLPLVARWRRLWVYRRQWNEAMTLCGLVKTYDGGRKVPALLSVRCTYATDEVRLVMPRGQNPETYHKAAPNLAYSFDSRHCRVFSGRRTAPPIRGGRWAWLLRLVDQVRYRDRPRHMWLVFIRRDPLTQIVPPLPVPSEPDFTALPLGLREDLEVYALRLLATHLLIAGATRMGKGSVIWSLVRALAAGISSGLVQVWAIDPKGGMELAIGQALFARYCDDDWSAMADLLDQAVEVMRERQARLRGKVRVHTPTVDDPLIVILIDEIACLVAYLPDSELRGRITASLALLLSQGAGLGVLVVAAVQDPRKEVLSLRDLFPTRVALGLTDRGQVDLVLGDGARDRGALADQIPITAKGVGYVLIDGQPEPARVRFSYVDDDLIRDMAVTYPAPPVLRPVNRHTYRPTPRPGPLLPPTLLDALNEGGEAA
ncbi:FtsK/SpoIIIE domain-containing protein [Micromonospora sp. CPCC 206061]|uniref:FtsK/SpoIIIE domain-containing protein n=1 Tax=Micromonospora sp. CPCC 206061 TaxID=3122410 RepID=UPI002FEEBAF4